MILEGGINSLTTAASQGPHQLFVNHPDSSFNAVLIWWKFVSIQFTSLFSDLLCTSLPSPRVLQKEFLPFSPPPPPPLPLPFLITNDILWPDEWIPYGCRGQPAFSPCIRRMQPSYVATFKVNSCVYVCSKNSNTGSLTRCRLAGKIAARVCSLYVKKNGNSVACL